MSAIVTGSSGLVGSAVVRALLDRDEVVVGLDNNLRSHFFGAEASTLKMADRLSDYARVTGGTYIPESGSVTSPEDVKQAFITAMAKGGPVTLVVHCAAQPSHDWAAQNPSLDFGVNAVGTLNMLEMTRVLYPEAVFVHVSTNKVYGDHPNHLPYVELDTRFEPDEGDMRWNIPGVDDPWDGFTESLSIDHTTHSLFGASKAAADLVAQEYGRYFGMNVGIFRCGCLTGSGHQGAKQHGFLSYLIKTAAAHGDYTVYGYGGKQVRDNLHAIDLARAFLAFADDPDPGAVYNMGGGRENSCSVIEAIRKVDKRGLEFNSVDLTGDERKGDHKWWITDTWAFETRYPGWKRYWTLDKILDEMVEAER